MKLQKYSCIAIILIAIFSIAGIISCGGDFIYGGGGGYSYTEDIVAPTNTGPSDTNDVVNTNETPTTKPEENWDNDPDNTKYPANTYYSLYTPFSGNNYRKISYQNTDKLTKIWQKTIEGGEKNINGHRWFIRDGNNYESDPRKGNYYFFDKNFDIVYVHQTDNNTYNLKVKKFLGGVIIDYCPGDGVKAHNHYGRGNINGTWVVGGLYETILSPQSDPTRGHTGKGYTDYNNDYLNIFMHARHERRKGDIEIIVMNIGWSDAEFKEFGLDSYYSTLNYDISGKTKNYANDKTKFLGQDPNTYTHGQTPSRLNWRVHLAWMQGWGFDDYDGGVYSWYKDNYKFFSAQTYDWHLNKDF